MQIADRIIERLEDPCVFHNHLRNCGIGQRLVIRPAISRCNQPQIAQAKIGHGARGLPYIFSQLRLDKDNRGRKLRAIPDFWPFQTG